MDITESVQPATSVKKYRIVALLALSAVVGVYLASLLDGGIDLFSNHDWSQSNIDESKRAGDTIVTALEAYRAAQGRYPYQLEQLVPTHLRAIPLPIAGEGVWHYFSNSPNSRPYYSLYFDDEGRDISCTHDENTGWDLRSNDF